MIVNIEQQQGKLIVSYVNKEGGISFSQINIPPNQQYIYVYSRGKAGSDPNFISWDGRPVRKVPSMFLSNHRIQELFMDAGEEALSKLFEFNTPKLFSCDIEVDVTDDGFAEPDDALNRINTIAWTSYPDAYVFGLKPLSENEIKEIQEKIDSHLKPLGKTYNFIYKQFTSESNMLYDFLYNYVRSAPLVVGWHFWNYDWRYIYNRCKRLNIDISWLSPTKQWYKHKIMDRNQKKIIMLPQHKMIVDYLEIYKKWDRKIEIKENNTLDFVAEAALGIKKIKYSGTFQDLYRDFSKYVFYNVIDAILVEEIHNKINTLATFLVLGNINRVEAMQAFSPVMMLTSTMTRYAYKRGWVFPKKETESQREDYEGAFVFKPDPNLYKWVAAFDYASLYPSIMRQFKISIENFIKKDKSYNPKPHEIKCSSGAIFDNSSEALLPEILTDYYGMRKDSQNIAKKAEIEINYLKKILEKRRKSIEM